MVCAMTDKPREPSTGWLLLRLLLGGVAALVLGAAAYLLLFVGAIEATGCFIECGEPNLVVGVPLLGGAVLAAGSAVTAFVWGIVGGRLFPLWRVFAWAAGVGLVLLVTVALLG